VNKNYEFDEILKFEVRPTYKFLNEKDIIISTNVKDQW